MKKYVSCTTAILALVAGFAIFLHAQASSADPGKRHGWGRGHGMMMGRIARELDLTDAQKAQIKSIWQAEKPVMQPLLQQLANDRRQMLAATANGQFDQTKVQTIANQQAQVLSQLIVERVKIETKVYSLLTPEQRTKADQLRQKQLDRLDRFGQGAGAGK